MDHPTLEERLNRLERQNWRLKAGLLALLALGGLGATSAAMGGGSDIEARQFRVTDSQGRTRAVLGPGSLVLYDADGKKTASLGEGATVYPLQ
jgi:hypothetical protein